MDGRSAPLSEIPTEAVAKVMGRSALRGERVFAVLRLVFCAAVL